MFRDRLEAGAALATRLEEYRTARPIVLGLTRGGVPVAAAVARILGAPLDVVVVRKLGAPGFPECAMGAIAEGGGTYVNAEVLRELELGEEDVAAIAEREAIDLARRVRTYRGDRGSPDVRGRTVILVDDGVATGATAHAASRAVRQRGAARVILAAPVIAAESEPELRPDADEIVAVARPSPFFALNLPRDESRGF
jgi:putative phosphoribosyl transferase